ncbi:MAG: hypothetical protein ACO1SV_00360 [Fimbriimonas sp.]
MSESTPPPPNYVAYPRPDHSGGEGSAARLEALGKGYFGLNWAFLANIVLAIGMQALSFVWEWGWLVAIPVVFTVVVLLTLPRNKEIGFGMGWKPSSAIVASVLMGLNSVLCCGIIGYIVMQNIAASEMKRKYGLRGGFLGIKKATVAEAVARLRQAEAGVPRPPIPG